MTAEDDKFWNEVAGKLRKKKGLCPLTPEVAEAAFDAAPEIPLSDEQVRSIAQSVRSGEMASWGPDSEEEWDEGSSVEEVGRQAMQLYRNKGEQDPETDRIEKTLEEELLRDDEKDEV